MTEATNTETNEPTEEQLNGYSLRNQDLDAMVAKLYEQRDARADYVAPASNIEAEGGRLKVHTADETLTLAPTDIMTGTMAQRLKIPVAHLREMGRPFGDPAVDLARLDAFDRMVNARLLEAEKTDRKFMLRTFSPGPNDGGISVGRALLSNQYKIVDNFDVLTTVLAGITEADHPVSITQCDLTESRMWVKVRSESVQYVAREFLKGYRNPFSVEHTGYQAGEEPIISAGFRVSNSETGGGKFKLEPCFEIRICRNGMVITEKALTQVHLGGRLKVGEINWAADTQQASLDLVLKMSRDAVREFMSYEFLEHWVKSFEEESQTPVADVQGTVEKLAKVEKWTEAEEAGILDRFMRGGQFTAGGAMQAVTAHAQDVVNPERAAALEASGIDVMRKAVQLVTA